MGIKAIFLCRHPLSFRRHRASSSGIGWRMAYRRMTIRGLMRTMIRDFGSDPQAGADVARVLRVPGFFHKKAEPYLVTIVEASGKRYSREELLEAFPPIEDTRSVDPASSHLLQLPTTKGSVDPDLLGPSLLQRLNYQEDFRIRSALKLIDPNPYDPLDSDRANPAWPL